MRTAARSLSPNDAAAAIRARINRTTAARVADDADANEIRP
jgi:hypothetical protein